MTQNNPEETKFGLQIAIIVISNIIAFILGIFFTPLKKLIYAEEEQYCKFMVYGSAPHGYKINVTKWFKKTTSINCGWFKERKETEFNKIKFLHCPFGQKPEIINVAMYRGGYCPFDSKSLKKFKK